MRRLPSLTLGLTAAGLTLVGAAPNAHAQIESGEASGYGAQLDLGLNLGDGEVASVDLLNPDSLGQVSSVSAPPPSSESADAVELDLNADADVTPTGGIDPVTLDLATASGTISSSASSNVDGGAGARQATATGTIEDADLALADVSVLGLADAGLLDLTADVVSSTSTVSGAPGSLSVDADTDIANLSLAIDGVDVDVLDLVESSGGEIADGDIVSVAPNTQLLDVNGVAGLDLFLNEQSIEEGEDSLGVTTNALRLSLDAISIAGLDETLTGEIILGQSQAQLTAVPEPTSLALLAAGALGLTARRRRRA